MYNLLPIGSVVLLNNTEHRIMIYGRQQKDVNTGKIYDYVGCLYPEGILKTSEVLLFNGEDIKLVFFIGFQDYDELLYRDELEKAILNREKGKNDEEL